MIVWGGVDDFFNDLNTGGRYNPGTDSWTATTTSTAPAARRSHTAIWTGTEMIVWGGFDDFNFVDFNTGGRYNPNTNTWTATSTNNVPEARDNHTAVWTGTEMIVWGGFNEEFFEVLPGVRETLQTVAVHPRYYSALLTGDIELAAYLKMELVGLAEFFTLPGAFGDESHDRRDLPAFAADRIGKHLRLDLAPEQFIVIGDTPNDIECARHFGARSLAVNTGRFYSEDAIRACKPDALLPDLSDVELTMSTLVEL